MLCCLSLDDAESLEVEDEEEDELVPPRRWLAADDREGFELEDEDDDEDELVRLCFCLSVDDSDGFEPEDEDDDEVELVRPCDGRSADNPEGQGPVDEDDDEDDDEDKPEGSRRRSSVGEVVKAVTPWHDLLSSERANDEGDDELIICGGTSAADTPGVFDTDTVAGEELDGTGTDDRCTGSTSSSAMQGIVSCCRAAAAAIASEEEEAVVATGVRGNIGVCVVTG